MYYQGTAMYLKEDDKGLLKSVREPYLIDALSLSEAEIKMNKWLGENIAYEFNLKSITESPIVDVFDYEGESDYFQFTCSYFSYEENGREKLIKNKMLVEAKNIDKALERIKECLSNMIVSFNIPEVKESKIVQVIQHEPKEEEEESEEQ